MGLKAIGTIALTAALALRLDGPESELPAARSSSITTTPDGRRIIVANTGSGSLSILDGVMRTRLAEIELGTGPSTVSVSADGRRAYAASRHGSVAVVSLETLSLVSFPAGREPFAVIEHAGRLFVSDTGDARVRIFDVTSLKELASIAVEESPRGLAIDPAGERLFVTHFRSGRISVIDLATFTSIAVLSTGGDSNLSQSIAFSAAGTRVFLPQTRSNSANPALLFDTTVFPIVAVIDAETLTHLPKERFSLDVVDRPGNMPIDAVVTAGGMLYIAYAGSDDLSIIDVATRKTRAHLQLGSNPSGLVLSPDERFVYANNSLSGTVSVIDTTLDTVVSTIPSTIIPLPPDLLNGKRLFHSSASTKLAKDRWISCATCHPDGGTDGRTWFFRDGPRNTPALFGVAATLPMHWSGDLDEMHDVESTIRIVQAGTGLVDGDANCSPACDQAPPNRGRSSELDDLVKFMASLRPPGRAPMASEASRRGEALFRDASVGCSSCHNGAFFTDRQTHDVGTGGPLERKGNAFDTPSLRGLFDTPPYFHDGSAGTLDDAITRHGNGARLTSAERADVAAFLRSIPFATPRVRATRHR